MKMNVKERKKYRKRKCVTRFSHYANGCDTKNNIIVTTSTYDKYISKKV